MAGKPKPMSQIKQLLQAESQILRVNLTKGVASMKEDCAIMIDQLRAIDNKRLMNKLGKVPVDIVLTPYFM